MSTKTSVLTIDTSTDRTTVGLVCDGIVVAELWHDDPLGHGEVLPRLVEQILREHGSHHEITAVAIGMGPGPFTGLRVGIAFGQSFAFARSIPWVGIDSLAALAWSVGDKDFCVAIDARRREFFIVRYSNGLRVSPITIIQREEFESKDGFTAGLPVHYGHPTAAALAALSTDDHTTAHSREPIYIRKPDAYPAPKDVKFRPWQQLDLVAIYDLEKIAYPEDPWSFEQFKEEFAGPSRFYLVAEHAGVIVGYAGVMVVGDVTDILTLTVAPEFRRRGIARELLKRMIDWSRNQKAEAVMLEMRVDNQEAHPLYLASGFRKISIRKDYYGPSRDAIVMRKELKK